MVKMASKNRVFIALYQQPNLKDSLRFDAGLSFYHWAIWIEPKGAKDTTAAHCFDVVGDDHSQTWQFRHDDSAQAIRSSGLVLRVMVGKLPQGVTILPDILGELRDIPLPNPASEFMENSVSWIAEALLILQENGLIEAFDVPELMQRAAIAADQARYERLRIGGKKINAVENRKFP